MTNLSITITILEISVEIFSVVLRSQFMCKPRDIHWKAVMRVLAYIKNSHGKRLFYKKYENAQISTLYVGYARNKIDEKSLTRCLIFIGGNLVM